MTNCRELVCVVRMFTIYSARFRSCCRIETSITIPFSREQHTIYYYMDFRIIKHLPPSLVVSFQYKGLFIIARTVITSLNQIFNYTQFIELHLFLVLRGIQFLESLNSKTLFYIMDIDKVSCYSMSIQFQGDYLDSIQSYIFFLLS